MHVMMVDKLWYPALNVAAHFEADFASTPAPKKAKEMMAVAVMIAAMQELQNRSFSIQGVPDSEQSPDVRTVCWDDPVDGKAKWGYQQDVEVVTYEEHSLSEPLNTFVAKTKLAPNTAYDDKTTILVDVQAGARLPTPDEWHSALSQTGKLNPVFVLGRIPGPYPYRLAIVHPNVEGAIDFHPVQLLKKRGYTKVQRFSRGSKAIETYDPSEKHCPFEKFGVACRLF